jgi:hypothetical protein
MSGFDVYICTNIWVWNSWVKDWYTRLLWSYSLSACGNFKPQKLDLAVELHNTVTPFHRSKIHPERSQWVSDSSTASCLLVTPPKNELYIWTGKLSSKLPQDGRTREKNDCFHIHRPNTSTACRPGLRLKKAQRYSSYYYKILFKSFHGVRILVGSLKWWPFFKTPNEHVRPRRQHGRWPFRITDRIHEWNEAQLVLLSALF